MGIKSTFYIYFREAPFCNKIQILIYRYITHPSIRFKLRQLIYTHMQSQILIIGGLYYNNSPSPFLYLCKGGVSFGCDWLC
jgi:hypothetical protein